MVKSQRKLLIVEDDAEIAETMQKALRRLGYEILGSVTSGEEAIEKNSELKPDCIIMDIMLSGDINGLEAGKEIKNRTNTPIIFITGYDEMAEAIRAVGRAPLVKPFTIEDLQVAIEVIFYRGKMASEE